MFNKRYLLYVLFVLVVLPVLVVSSGQISAQDNGVCPTGETYWKSTPTWPVTQLTLGNQVYSQVELIILLNTPSDGDASLILVHQIIAAKLNMAQGVDAAVIASVITQGDAVLASYTGRLPYNIPASDSIGETLVNLSTILSSYNAGQLSIGCAPAATLTPTPAATVEVTPEATVTVTPEATAEATAQPTAPVIIVIEGPVQAINVNIITIYNINIQLADDDPNLKIIQVGDVVRIEGSPEGNVLTGNITIIAITVVVINVEVDNSTGQIWRDDSTCANPPPPWAPANGWRRRCQNNNNQGNDDDKHNKHKDDD